MTIKVKHGTEKKKKPYGRLVHLSFNAKTTHNLKHRQQKKTNSHHVNVCVNICKKDYKSYSQDNNRLHRLHF